MKRPNTADSGRFPLALGLSYPKLFVVSNSLTRLYEKLTRYSTNTPITNTYVPAKPSFRLDEQTSDD